MKKQQIHLTSVLLMRTIRFVARIPDPILVPLLRVAAWATVRLTGDPAAAGPVREILEIAETDPAGMNVLRNLLLKGREAQFIALLEGTITHHVGPEPNPPPEMPHGMKRQRNPRRSPKQPLRVGVVGDDLDAELLCRAYGGRPDCALVPVEPARLLEDEEALMELDLLEVDDPGLIDEAFLLRALEQEVAVSLHHRRVDEPELARRLLLAARRGGGRFRVFCPTLSYPPLLRVKRMLDDDLLGEVCSIRVRATIGGKGGRLPPDPPDPDRYLDHPAFDQFLLLAALGGKLQSVTAYLNPMHPERGGQGLVDCKFASPARYALLECTFSPDLFIRSDYHPYDLEVEVAGSDGIVWMRRGMAKRTQSAPVEVRVGRKAYSVGVECGLPEDWGEAHAQAAALWAAAARGQAVPSMDDATLLSALRLKERVYEAARSPEVITL